MTTRITKWGNGYGIRIPKEIMNELNLSEGVECEVRIMDGSIQIKPIKNKKSIKSKEK